MKKNMGSIDKWVRFTAALLIGVLYYAGIINGTTAIVLGVLALIFIVTSMVNFCPLYLPFGISTRPKSK